MKKGWIALFTLLLLILPCQTIAGMLGAEAPDFSLKDLEGNPISLSSFSGKVVMLVHFNTYCHSCREEVSLINHIFREHNKNLQIIGIAIANDERETMEFKKNFKPEYLLVVDPEKEVYEKYYVHTVPLIDIIDRTGTIRYRGKLPGHTEAKAIMKKIIDEKEVVVGAELWNSPPDFTLKNTQGETFRLYDHIGKKTIALGFMSVRDEGVRKIVEILKTAYSRYKREDLDMVRVAVQNSLEEVKDFRKKYYVNFPILVDEKGEIAELYNVDRPPKLFIINKKSKIRYINDYKEISLNNLASVITKIESYFREELPESLLVQYFEKAAPSVKKFDKLVVGDNQIVYIGTSEDNEKIFVREIFKDVLCDVCTNVHFVYSFDQNGKIKNIVLIESIDLYGVPIEAEDFLHRVIQKANQKLPLKLRKDIDALSGATQSCKLILEGLNETTEIINSFAEHRDRLVKISE